MNSQKKEIVKGLYNENKWLKESKNNYGYRGAAPISKHRKRTLGKFAAVIFLAIMMVVSRYIVFPYFNNDDIPAAEPTLSAYVLPWSSALNLPEKSDYITVPPAVNLSYEEQLNYGFILDNKEIRLSSLFDLSVHTIVIDPGHGGKDGGAVGSLGTLEKDVVLDIGLQLRALLEQSGNYKVIMTRDEDVFIPLADRVAIANENKADLFISLHLNSIPQKEYNLVETYYFGPPKDDETMKLAKLENKGADITNSEFNSMILKIKNTVKTQESAVLATAIQRGLFRHISKYDKTISDKGTKVAPFLVLLATESPSVLLEISCISKEDEERHLKDPVYRAKISMAIKDGIMSYLALK